MSANDIHSIVTDDGLTVGLVSGSVWTGKCYGQGFWSCLMNRRGEKDGQ